MAWARIETELYRHPKVEAIPERERAAALALYLAAILHSAETLTNGRVSRPILYAISASLGQKRPSKLVSSLVKAGLFEQGENGGFVIHDYLQYQDSRDTVEGRRRADRERKREARSQERLPGLEGPLSARTSAADFPADSPARARGRTSTAAGPEDLALGSVSPTVPPETRELESTLDPAAAAADVGPTDLQIQTALEPLRGYDAGTYTAVEPLARAVSARRFLELVQRAATARSPIGLLVTLLQVEIRGQRAAHAQTTAAQTANLPPRRSRLDELERTDPTTYVREIGWKLPDEILEEALMERVEDPDQRAALLEQAHALRSAQA